MIKIKCTTQYDLGLMRHQSRIVNYVLPFKSTITGIYNGKSFNMKQPVSIGFAAVREGEPLKIIVEGEDEFEAAKAVLTVLSLESLG